MDSLYGGHQGNSFVLRNSFQSYSEMVAAFKQGPQYTDVWYNEYCILDTPNKNDADNGKIYKRGLNYQDSTGGAQYIAQVVGPSSGTPYFQMDTIANVKKQSTKTLEDYEYRRYPVDNNGDGMADRNSDGSVVTTESIGALGKLEFSAASEGGLVPGKTTDGKYNDTIQYTWVNVRKDNADADSWFYVGWQIPYTVIDYKIHQTSPYDSNHNILTDATEIKRVDTKTHPFYEQWDLGLPKGIKGDTLRNLRVITPTSANKNNIYDHSAIIVNKTTGATTLGSPGYTGIDDDITNARQILVFDYYIYDKVENPTAIQIYLGDFNIIKNIAVADDGTLTISYTHNANSVFSKKIKWVQSMSLTTGNGSAGGRFTVNYNNGSTPFTANLTWIKDIQIDKNDGTVTYTYAGTNGGTIPNNGIVTVPNLVKWVTDTSLDANTGRFEMNFNDDTQYSKTLDWVKNITINESTGSIVVNHTTGNVTSAARLKILTSAETSSTGVVTLHFNTGETINLKNLNAETDYRIKVIDNVTLSSSILEDKRIRIKYNTNSTSTPIGDPINYIESMVVRPEDFHLFVLYSDPSHRATAADLTEGVDSNGVSWISNDEVRGFDSSIPNHGSTVYWRDYGTIKDQHGILIGFNVTYEDMTGAGFNDIIKYLDATYPNGLTGEQNIPGGAATKQKIITFNPQPVSSEKKDKEFYAYDYNTFSWYYLGTIADTGTRDVLLLNQNNINANSIKNLNSQGLLFKHIATTTSDSAMPSYWDKAYKWA